MVTAEIETKIYISCRTAVDSSQWGYAPDPAVEPTRPIRFDSTSYEAKGYKAVVMIVSNQKSRRGCDCSPAYIVYRLLAHRWAYSLGFVRAHLVGQDKRCMTHSGLAYFERHPTITRRREYRLRSRLRLAKIGVPAWV